MAVTEQSARASRTLDELYRRHAAEVYRYMYAVLGNHADAEDVTQATFVNALRALERGERPRKPANWLLVIAHNLVRQRFRQAQSRPIEVALEAHVPQPASADDDGLTVDELVAALGRIPPAQREAIVMREFEGRSYAEIAQILGVTTAALETLLFRARRSLAEELENLVTCARAEEDMSRLLDGRLSRRERRRLQEHIRDCPACARLETLQRRQHRALKGLAVLPLPASLTLFKGTHTATAAGLPTIGIGAATTGAAGGAAASGGAFGGLAVAGMATKAAAVVAAVVVTGGVGYEGVTHLGQSSKPDRPAAPAQLAPRGPAQKETNGPTETHAVAGGESRPASVTHPSRGHRTPTKPRTSQRRGLPGALKRVTGDSAAGKHAAKKPAAGTATRVRGAGTGTATRTRTARAGASTAPRGNATTRTSRSTKPGTTTTTTTTTKNQRAAKKSDSATSPATSDSATSPATGKTDTTTPQPSTGTAQPASGAGSSAPSTSTDSSSATGSSNGNSSSASHGNNSTGSSTTTHENGSAK